MWFVLSLLIADNDIDIILLSGFWKLLFFISFFNDFFLFSSGVTSKPERFKKIWLSVPSTGFNFFFQSYHEFWFFFDNINQERSLWGTAWHVDICWHKITNHRDIHFELFVSLLLTHFCNFLHIDSLPFGSKSMQFANVTSIFSYTVKNDYLINMYRCLLWHLKFCLMAWGIAFSS